MVAYSVVGWTLDKPIPTQYAASPQLTPYTRFGDSSAFPGEGLKFEAILDTGFSGFVSIPTIRAFPLGLPLYGTSESVLADGTTATSLTARCRISLTSTMGHKSPYVLDRFGVATLQYASQEVLLGMDFLRSFGLAMLLTKELVFLFAESDAAKVAESTPGNEPTPGSQSAQVPWDKAKPRSKKASTTKLLKR